jgi:Spy/CpxP family protein refolding chaperone
MVNDDPPGNKNSNDDASKQVEENEAVMKGANADTTTDATSSTPPTTGAVDPTAAATAAAAATSSQVAATAVEADDNDDDDEEGSTDGTENEKTATGQDSPGYSADQSVLAGRDVEHIAIHKHHPPVAVAVPTEQVAEAEETEPVTAAVAAAAETSPVVAVQSQGPSAKDDILNQMLVHEVSVITSSQQQLQQHGDQEEKHESKAERVEDLDSDPLLSTVNVQKIEDSLQNIEDSEKPEDVYVNVGLVHWEKQRLAWLAMNRHTGSSKYEADHTSSARAGVAGADKDRNSPSPFQAIPVDVDEIIDVIFQSPKQWREEGGPRRFPCAVPLPQMVDILQDLWEAEGLDT